LRECKDEAGENGGGGVKGNNKQGMRIPFIKDRDLYSAVSFSIAMIRKGQNPGIANTRAAEYYGVDVKEVAHYVGIHASHKRYE
jgi:hypothetical protein